MATPQKINITAQDTGLWKVKQTDGTAKKASDLLQQDLEKHHVFFNDKGFHNHIVHHILSLYGTGAEAKWLQKGFDKNANYQRPVQPVHQRVIKDLNTWDNARKYLNKEQYYPDFLAFFQKEISAKGWEAVMSEYVLSGTESADDMLARLYGGILHPLIQLMYGMEWSQPAIVAEALAQACAHPANLKALLLAAEKGAKDKARSDDTEGQMAMPNIMSLYEAIRANNKLNNLTALQDVTGGSGNDEILPILSQVRINPEDFDERTAEMFDACLYVTTSATFNPPKWNKYDFFLMHHVNLSPIHLTINAQPWIPAETKARWLEWKIRMDLVQYAARSAPPLVPVNEIAAYKVKDKSTSGRSSVGEVISRLHSFEEDGHAIKLARATVICHDLSKKYEGRDWMKLRGGDDLWLKITQLIVDSVVEAPGESWVRGAGLDEAWKDIPDRYNL